MPHDDLIIVAVLVDIRRSIIRQANALFFTVGPAGISYGVNGWGGRGGWGRGLVI